MIQIIGRLTAPPANVEAARALGMVALKFVSVHELAVEVQPFNLPAPLAAGGTGMPV